jgi:Set1/Ash2 histone methyltransferase complex subunit ASH2
MLFVATQALIKFKNYFYFEERDEQVDEFEKTLRPLPGSKIEFFKNGVTQGVAWTDIYAGTYYPALSLYRGATVMANFGPGFKHPPRNVTYSPMSQAAELGMLQQTMSEMLFHVDCRLASQRED